MGRKKGKRQLDPSRDEAESTDSEQGEGDEVNHTACPHVGKAVQLSSIKKSLKIAWVRVGQCATCLKESKTTTTPVKRVRNEVLRKELGGKLTLQEIKKEQLERAKAEQRAAAEKLKKEREGKAEESSPKIEENVVKPEVVEDEESKDTPVPTKADESKEVEKLSIWLCMRCGSQGCGNNSKKHSYSHYKQPRSDLHCLVVNTDTWAIWCYECQTEIYVDSHKKLYETVEFVKKVKGQTKVPIQSKNNTLPFGGVIKTVSKDVPATNHHAVVGSAGSNSLPLPRVKGLNNLGNTCFFNSVMQCLSQTHILTQFIDLQVTQGVNFIVPGSSANIQEESDSDSSHINPNIFSDLSLRLAEGGPMITSLAAFLKDMHSGGKSLVISPGHLFGQVVKQSPKFRGMQQQDSHELLRYLMDGLRSEESKRQKSAILKHFDLTEKTDPKNVPVHLRRQLQAYGRQGNHTLTDKIFSGQMVSTIVCEECHHSSQMYEQFLDLSLPVVEDKPTKPHKSPKKLTDTVLPDDEGQVSCCGAQEEKKRSKGQIKKEKERKRKENRGKKFSRQVSKAESIEEKEEGEKKIREELQGTEKFEKVELKFEDGPKIVDEGKHERQDSVTWKDRNNDEEEGYEEGEEEGVAEDEGEWEWDYGGPLEDKQQLVFKPKSKETTETNDDTSDYLDTSVVEEDPSKLVSLNPLPEISIEFEHDRSSERTGNNSEEETNETGASSNGDVEDNDCEDDKRKWVLSKNLLNNLQKLDNLMMNNDNLDPHMQELCKGISQLRMEKSEVLDKEKQQKQRVKAEWTARTLTSLAPRYLSSPGECSLYSCLNSFTQSELLTGPNKWACDSCTENKKLNSAENSDCSSSSKKSSTVYSSASKQLLLFSPPAVLTLHLKRFQQTLSGCKKVNKHVAFPLELDLAAFCSSTSIAMPNVSLGQRKVLYSLYGVVEHSGRLQGGHYTAFVKVRAANSSLKDPTIFFSPAVSKASDVPQFLEEIEGKFRNNEIIVGKEDVEEETNNNLTLSQPRRWYHVSDSSVSEVSEEKVLKAQAYLLFYERIL
eukprot:TRINITY_DN8428_c0_g1_i1.p1 TRINITY_DN8428_c0_g1~~TRINITY_DN8428_c0_g1_i1.p1  ORF type:complete len:1052 (-),score=368.79 TRINITY_DN8428_c0_g1_i1:130-3285(-)